MQWIWLIYDMSCGISIQQNYVWLESRDFIFFGNVLGVK